MNPMYISVYDDAIKKYHQRYNLPYDWMLLKAQLYQESCLDPIARSSVGAEGLAQFMPATWVEYVGKCSLPANTCRTNATASIQCCAAYMHDLLKGWSGERSSMDRYCLALASYNAGFGNLLKAQKMVHGVNDYATIMSALKFVTGNDNAKQTTDYVNRIRQYHFNMLATTGKQK